MAKAKDDEKIGKSRQKLIAIIKTKPGMVLDLLQRVVDSYENEGCDGCGTIDESVCNDIRDFLGFNRV